MENTHLHIGFNFYEKRHLEKGGFETEVISKAFMDVIGRGPGSKKSPERAKISKKKETKVQISTGLDDFGHLLS